jgi:hypothetical protein
MFGGLHDHACHTPKKKNEDKCMQNQQKKDIGGTQKPKCWKSLFIGAKAFMHVTKKGVAFLIYFLPMSNAKSPHHDILSHYKEFKDVFEKKIVDTLLEHCPYDCTIDFEEGSQPPFKPIHNLSQDELVALHKYIDENFEKGFI